MVTLSGDLELTAVYRSTTGSAEEEKQFSTQMSGKEEVPLAQTNATGMAELKLSDDGNSLSYKLTISGIDNVTMAHLHMAPKGSNGPVVVTLFNSTTTPVNVPAGGGVLAQGTITADKLTGPLAGMTIADLVDKIRAEDIYANVHTTEFPNGAMRGQFD